MFTTTFVPVSKSLSKHPMYALNRECRPLILKSPLALQSKLLSKAKFLVALAQE